MMGWGYGAGMGPWGWLMMGGFWLLVLAVAIGAVAWIFPRDRRAAAAPDNRVGSASYPGGSGPASVPASQPLSTLDDRLARGEIDIETYRALRAELGSATAAPSGTRSTGAGAEKVR